LPKLPTAGSSVTIYDVAAAAGVSIKTVSRVLNREPNVKPGTRQMVMAAAAKLQYRPNVSARSLAGSRSYLLGLLFDNPSRAYVSELQFGALHCCRQEGYHLLVEAIDSTAGDVVQSVEAMLQTLKIDGLILTPPVCDLPDVLEMLDRSSTPYVRIAPEHDAARAARVNMDDRLAAYQMTELLLGLGHRDIGFIKGHPDHGAAHLRFEGYLDALRDHGAPVRPERISQGYFSFKSGVESAEALLGDDDRPTAIFASNDEMALGIMSVASRRGLVIPQQLSIAGFDDSPSAKVVWPQLTTVRQPVVEMARAAAEMLIFRATRSEDGAAASRLLDFEIIARESTAALTVV